MEVKVAIVGRSEADTLLKINDRWAVANAKSTVGIVDSAMPIDTYNPVSSFDYFYEKNNGGVVASEDALCENL